MSQKNPRHYAVIGSGPSGVACASALLELGARVTLIDAGLELSPERQARRDVLAGQAPADWSPADRDWLTSDLRQSGNSEPVKRLFGDDFIYAGADWTIEGGVLPKGFGARPSLALGGLSRVWGAALKRFGQADLAQWPIAAGALDPHYDRIEMQIAHTLRNTSENVPLPFSPQAEKLFGRWRMRESELAGLGIAMSQARMAVSQHCRLCGMCLYGCPYGYIFSSDAFVRLYRDLPGFAYRPGLRVSRLEELGSETRIHCVADDGTQETLSAERVFVGAGVLGTARMMLASFGGTDDHLLLRDSQRFLLPFLSANGHPPHAPIHTLSQIFLDVTSTTGADNAHVQIYSYNDFYAARIRAALGPLGRLASPLANFAGRHFTLAQGFMHSRDSGTATLRLTGARNHPVLTIAPDLPERTRGHVGAFWAQLGRAGRLAGMVPLTSFAEVAAVGAGFHSGAIFPMSHRPEGWQSDALGRVRSLARVHVVDGSVLPEMPGGPVTLSIMANAHRIGTEAAMLDGGYG